LSNHVPICKKIVAQIAPMGLILALVLIGSSLFAQTGIVAGLRYTDGPVQGFFGGIQTYNDHISIVGTAEVDESHQAYALQPVVTFKLFDKLYLGGLVGPNVERVELSPTDEIKITYLMNSTGALLAYRFTDRFAGWVGYNHKDTDKLDNKYQIFAGVVSYLD